MAKKKTTAKSFVGAIPLMAESIKTELPLKKRRYISVQFDSGTAISLPIDFNPIAENLVITDLSFCYNDVGVLNASMSLESSNENERFTLFAAGNGYGAAEHTLSTPMVIRDNILNLAMLGAPADYSGCYRGYIEEK